VIGKLLFAHSRGQPGYRACSVQLSAAADFNASQSYGCASAAFGGICCCCWVHVCFPNNT